MALRGGVQAPLAACVVAASAMTASFGAACQGLPANRWDAAPRGELAGVADAADASPAGTARAASHSADDGPELDDRQRPAARRVRLDESRSPATAAATGDGTAAYWQRSMLWQQRGPVELGFGVAVQREVQAHGPWAANRGADTSSLAASGLRGAGGSLLGGVPGAPAMALFGVGRSITPSMSMGLGMDVPLNRGLNFRSRAAYDDLRQGLAMRMQLGSATALTVRPRSGRVTLQLSSRW